MFTRAGVVAPLRCMFAVPGSGVIVPTVFCACAAGTAVTIVSIASPNSAAIRKELILLCLCLCSLSFFPS
jgi:hypothetical protein